MNKALAGGRKNRHYRRKREKCHAIIFLPVYREAAVFIERWTLAVIGSRVRPDWSPARVPYRSRGGASDQNKAADWASPRKGALSGSAHKNVVFSVTIHVGSWDIIYLGGTVLWTSILWLAPEDSVSKNETSWLVNSLFIFCQNRGIVISKGNTQPCVRYVRGGECMNIIEILLLFLLTT